MATTVIKTEDGRLVSSGPGRGRGRSNGSGNSNSNDADPTLKARAYQTEMLEKSKKGNVIVSMDTGSGKTPIAALRIQHELEKGNGLLCWFLVPNKALAHQQHGYLKETLSAYHHQVLTGRDKVEKWSTREKWDQVLGSDEAVIVTTYQVLLDALHHGFVNLQRIGLIVFDEAHHCIGESPANNIMRDFYWRRSSQGLPVPSILGLTASPTMGVDVGQQLCALEKNLDSRVVSPIETQGDLSRYVHIPDLRKVFYGPEPAQWSLEQAVPQQASPSELAMPKPLSSGTLKWDDFLSREPSSTAHEWDVVLKPLTDGPLPDLSFDPHLTTPPKEINFSEPEPGTFAPPSVHSTPSKKTRLGELDEDGYSEDTSGSASESDEYEVYDIETYEPIRHSSRKRKVTPFAPAAYQAYQQPTALSSPTRSSSRSSSDEDFDQIDPFTNEPFTGSPEIPPLQRSKLLQALIDVRNSMAVSGDPHPKNAKNSDTAVIERFLTTRDTFCQRQMKNFVNKATHLNNECGDWAADWYISESLQAFMKKREHIEIGINEIDSDEDGTELSLDMSCDIDEEIYLRDLLANIELPENVGDVEGRITEKVEKLIEVLLEEYRKEGAEEFSGLIFVEQRVTVMAIAQILSRHEDTRDLLRTGTMVGTSNAGRKRWLFPHPLENANMDNALEEFKTGEKNLIVATSVMEEGLDYKDCHLVVCYTIPQNMKSFVQRRGRARRSNSSYVIFLNRLEQDKINQFLEAEKEMKQMYENEERRRDSRERGERADDEFGRQYGGKHIETTGAFLTINIAVSHLNHFCNVLPADGPPPGPEYLVTETLGAQDERFYHASVILPNSLPAEVRKVSGKRTWSTQKWAKMDAAYEAYSLLHDTGHVDDNLMPQIESVMVEEPIEKRPELARVDGLVDPWELIEDKWQDGALFLTTVEVEYSTGEKVGVEILLPGELPRIEDLKLFWTKEETAMVKFGPTRRVGEDPERLEQARRATYRLLRSIYANRMEKDKKDFAFLLVPQPNEQWDRSIDPTGVEQVRVTALDAFIAGMDIAIVRDGNLTPYIFRRFRKDIAIEEAQDFKGNRPKDINCVDQSQPLLECQKISKRRDFLHEEAGNRSMTSEKTLLLLPEFLFLETLPWRYMKLALLVPFIVDRVEKTILAADLRQKLTLPSIPTHLVTHAITASSVRDPVNCQRLEFLGDSVLKVLTSIALFDEHPNWHEGLLSALKDRVVSNHAACRVAQTHRLSRYILTDPFTAAKWSPPHFSRASESPPEKELSTKVLADVVESIIGVSYVSGGYRSATDCLKIFNFGVSFPWSPISHRVRSIVMKASEASSRRHRYPGNFKNLENLLGHTFENRSLLLEAVTHVSFGTADTQTRSYQRLEFLGDSILDMVIVDHLYKVSPQLSHEQMHLLKSAAVNADFLAFLCLGFGFDAKKLVPAPTRYDPEHLETQTERVRLYSFLRSNHSELLAAQRQCMAYYLDYHQAIDKQFLRSKIYPWAQLAHLNAPKFLSDIIESLIGAIWIDSNGSWRAVETFLARLGLWRYLERWVKDKINAEHPKTRFGNLAAQHLRAVRYPVQEYRARKKKLWRCEVFVDEECIAHVEGAATSEHAKTWAADEALKSVDERGLPEKKGKDREEVVEEEETDEENEEGETGDIFYDAIEY